MIGDELAAFIESGVSVLVGTRDERLVPDATRGLGARVERGGEELTVWLAAAVGARAVANARATGRIAVCFSAFENHRSYQVKGALLELRDGVAADRPFLEACRARFVERWGKVGVPPRVALRLSTWPCHALRLRVERLFDQTPGPGAGAPLGLRR